MKISIVMPTYNGMKYLPLAVDSVLSQEHHDWNLIISDDGSTDKTREYLSSLKDPRIQIYFQEQNLGIFGNLNFLFSLAQTEITQILCQDDFLADRGALGRVLDLWSKLPPEVAFLRCNHGQDAHCKLNRYETRVVPPVVDPAQSDLLFLTFGCIPGNLSNVSLRTKVVKDAGWFRTDLPYAGDFEFWSRVGRSYAWAASPMQITVVRFHKEQASVTLNLHGELLPQLRAILTTLFENLKANGYSPVRMRLATTIHYVSQHRDIGVKALFKGKGTTYLRGVSREFDTADFSLGPVLGWILYFVSMGGRRFTVAVAKGLLRNRPSRT